MNFIELLEEHHVPQAPENHEHVRAGWIQIDCPFCSPNSQRYRLGWNLQYNYANCWSCGHVNAKRLLTTLFHISFKEAEKFLKGVTPERQEKHAHIGKYVEPSGVGELLYGHRKYIYHRGFSIEEIQKLWSVQGIGIAPRLSWRLFIPIFYHGQKVSWTTRAIGEVEPRYMSASLQEEYIDHKNLLYGEDFCRHAIVVCEGPIDAWAIGPGAVATFGLSFTTAQLRKMAKYSIRAICFDNEPHAQLAATKLVKQLSVFPGQTYNIQLDSKDPGEAKHREIARIRKEILS